MGNGHDSPWVKDPQGRWVKRRRRNSPWVWVALAILAAPIAYWVCACVFAVFYVRWGVPWLLRWLLAG